MSVAQVESIALPGRCKKTPSQGAYAVAQSIASKAVILGLQAGTGILTARALRPWGRGELAAMILWPLFVASITTLGVPSSLIYFLRHAAAGAGSADRKWVSDGDRFSAWWPRRLPRLILPWCLRQYSPSIIRAAEWFLITVPHLLPHARGAGSTRSVARFFCLQCDSDS